MLVPFVSLQRCLSAIVMVSSLSLLVACGGAASDDIEGMSDVEGYTYYKSFKPEVVYGKIRYCHDGDTCSAEIDDGTKINLRLAGIDAPEVSGGERNKGQPFGSDARDFTNGKVKGQRVRIHKIELDPYRRTVAEIYLNGKLINIQLVEKGYAEAYKWATWKINKSAYRNAEYSAKKKRTGVWSMGDYESPSAFRHK